MPAADEKIRVAQVALQEAMDEKEYDIRELPLAEARLERLQKEVAMSRPATRPAPTAPDLEAEVQRLRAQVAEMQAAQTPIRPPQSSALSADLLRERASKRRAGFTETIPSDPQDTCGFPGCDRSWRPGVDPRYHGFDSHRCGTVQDVPFHCLQHGDLRGFARIVIHQCGFLGCRVGEATNPGPPRRMRRVVSDTS